MKKIFLVLFFVFSSFSAYGASSDDVYLRQDVFEAKMESLYNRLHGEIQVLSEKIDGINENLSNQIAATNANLSNQIAATNKRIDDLYNIVYWIFVMIGALLVLPFIQHLFGWWEGRRSKTLTAEDVKKMIDEAFLANNLRLQGK